MSRFGELLRKGWRGAQNQAGIVLAGIGVFLLAFLLGLHLFFPTAAVQQWLSSEISARAPLSVQFANLSLRPLFTLGGKDVVVAFDNLPGQTIMLDELRLKPLWTSLVSGDPGVTVDASLLQGRFAAALRRGGSLDLHAAGVKLTNFPVHQETRTLLSGTIVKADLRGSLPARKTTETRLALEIDNSTLTVLGQPLPLGKILLEGSGQGSNLRIATLSASGGQLAISGTGTVLLGASAAASRINLDLTLRPAASTPPTLTALLDIAAQRQADNGYRLKLSGPPNRLTVERPEVAREPARAQAENEE